MELIVISDSKLKIMLTSEDLRAYSLDCSTLDYENTETRRAFWSILDEAKHRTGFDAASEKVFVQVYPSRSGGCEMYVTKLGMFSDIKRDGDEEDEEDIRISERDMRGGGGLKKCPYILHEEQGGRKRTEAARPTAYRFENMELLLRTCRRLWNVGFSGESSAYLGEDGCYLLLRDDEEIQDCGMERGAFISEYAEELDEAAFSIYIGEHGKCICDRKAVDMLGKLI